MFNWRKSVTD